MDMIVFGHRSSGPFDPGSLLLSESELFDIDADPFSEALGRQPRIISESYPGEAEPFVFNESNHSARLLASLRYMRDRNQLFDVTLMVEGQEFSAHRVVLASCSDYFHAMFTNGLKESSQQCITLSGVTAAAMEQLIHFAYTSRLQITKDNVVALLSGASHVQMLPAVAACERYLCDHVTLSNCMAMEKLADIYSLQALTRMVHAFICQNLRDFVTTSSFTSLAVSQLLAVLLSDFPVFCPEVQVLEAVFIWLDHDISKRGCHCESLLTLVRWENIEAREVSQLLSSALAERVLPTCSKVRNMLLRYFPSLQVLKEAKFQTPNNVSIVNIAYDKSGKQAAAKDIQPHMVRSANDSNGNAVSQEVVLHKNHSRMGRQLHGHPSPRAVNLSTIHVTNSVSSVCITTNSASSVRVTPNSSSVIRVTNSAPAAARISIGFDAGGRNNKMVESKAGMAIPGVVNTRGFRPTLLLVGGFHLSSEHGSSSNNILCLQPGSEAPVTYTTIPHLPQTGFGMAVMNNCLYVVGGCCNEDFSEITHPYAFSFNPVTAAWTSLPPMLQERCRFSLVTLHGLLYAVGGEVDNSQLLASCEVFDPKRGVWSPVASLPSSRSELAACAMGDKLYVSGGGGTEDMTEQVHSQMWCYHPDQDSWSLKAAMLHARADHSMLAHNHHLYAIGGWSLNDGERVPVLSVDRYDAQTDSWQTVQRMKTARRYCTCTLLDGKVYVIGGGWEGGAVVREKREVDVLDLNTLQWQQDVVSVPTIWEHCAIAIHLPRKP